MPMREAASSGADEVIRRHAPRGAPIALVFDSPHSGERYPDDFDHEPPRSLVRQAEGTHLARLLSERARATLIEALFPRGSLARQLYMDEAMLEPHERMLASSTISRSPRPCSPSTGAPLV
jgi:hypothetical protein